MIDRARITGLVLAGGRSLRMGGLDKASLLFRGGTLLGHVIGRLAPQVGTLIVNGRFDLHRDAADGLRIVADRVGGQPGPLAGIDAGLAACTTEFLVTVPCDTPFFPLDLVERLVDALTTSSVSVATAATPLRQHPVFAAMRADVGASVTRALEQGQRSVSAWLASRHAVPVLFDHEAAFANCNTLDELHLAERFADAPRSGSSA